MSRKAASKGRAVLEGLGLDTEAIETCFNSHPLNEEGAVQAGLIKWSAGQSHKPSTWNVLLAAMEYAEIAEKHVQGLKKELRLFRMLFKCAVADVCLCAYVHVCDACILRSGIYVGAFDVVLRLLR